MRQWWTTRTARERAMLLVCAAAVVVGAVLVLMPSAGTGSRLLPARQARQNTRELQAAVAGLQTQTASVQKDLRQNTFTEPPDRLIPKVVRLLQDRAKDAGVHLRDVKPLRARKVGEVTRVPLSVRFTTTEFAPSVVRFLYDLEEPAGRLAVGKFTVTVSDPKTRTVDVEVQVVCYTSGEA